MCARRTDRLQELAASIGALGAEVLVQAVDVARARAEVRAFVDATVARFGRLDVLVNNAGLRRARVAWRTTPADDYRRLMEVNYLGTVYGCRAAIPVMRGRAAA